MKKSIVLIALIAILFSSCTDNQRAKNFGGKSVVTLQPNQRVVNVTWKQDDMWILYKVDTTKPYQYTFKESSSWGILEGEVTIKEQ